MDLPIVISSEEDWEIVNDDGFIYKRRKKERALNNDSQNLSKRDNNATQNLSKHISLPEDDKHFLRMKKKEELLTLKARYATELEEWEALLFKQRQPLEPLDWPDDVSDSPALGDPTAEVLQSNYQELTERLLFQVERQEQCIRMITELCVEAEVLCKRFDEDFNFVRFPIGMSPRCVMHGIVSPD